MSKRQKLAAIIEAAPPMAIAVSGGVDSMTLAIFVNSARPDCIVFHALSPAVPPQASVRVREFAALKKWQLQEIVAGEFDDTQYLANPYNRCFYCKTNLYGEIRKHTDRLIVSGTNSDDLSDYRPGLNAAENFLVRHPFVEAGMDKDDIRRLARSIGTDTLAELPASPCLSSRIETGLAINARTLTSVNNIEQWLIAEFNTGLARCRIRAREITIEVDPQSLASLDVGARARIRDRVTHEFSDINEEKKISFRAYVMGSAFVPDGATR